MRTTGRIVGLAAAGLLTAATLAACGSSDSVAEDPGVGASSPITSPSSDGTTAPSGPTGPACATVWKKGGQLPHAYKGCMSDAKWVKAEVYQCSDGHRLITFAHVFYASPGRTISRAATTLAQDQDFRQTMAVCGA
jgi:hypothetical protein